MLLPLLKVSLFCYLSQVSVIIPRAIYVSGRKLYRWANKIEGYLERDTYYHYATFHYFMFNFQEDSASVLQVDNNGRWFVVGLETSTTARAEYMDSYTGKMRFKCI